MDQYCNAMIGMHMCNGLVVNGRCLLEHLHTATLDWS